MGRAKSGATLKQSYGAAQRQRNGRGAGAAGGARQARRPGVRPAQPRRQQLPRSGQSGRALGRPQQRAPGGVQDAPAVDGPHAGRLPPHARARSAPPRADQPQRLVLLPLRPALAGLRAHHLCIAQATRNGAVSRGSQDEQRGAAGAVPRTDRKHTSGDQGEQQARHPHHNRRHRRTQANAPALENRVTCHGREHQESAQEPLCQLGRRRPRKVAGGVCAAGGLASWAARGPRCGPIRSLSLLAPILVGTQLRRVAQAVVGAAAAVTRRRTC